VFLESRSNYISGEIRKLKFEGDIVKHIEELSRLVFSAISITCDDFCVSFDKCSMMSGFPAPACIRCR